MAVVAVTAEAEVVATIRLTLVPADLFQNETGGLQTCLIGCPLWLFLYLFVAALLIFLSCTLLTNAFYLPTDDFDGKTPLDLSLPYYIKKLQDLFGCVSL